MGFVFGEHGNHCHSNGCTETFKRYDVFTVVECRHCGDEVIFCDKHPGNYCDECQEKFEDGTIYFFPCTKCVDGIKIDTSSSWCNDISEYIVECYEECGRVGYACNDCAKYYNCWECGEREKEEGEFESMEAYKTRNKKK